MKYDFDNIANRYNTNSCKYNCKENELPMWIADMDFKVLPEIAEAIVNKVKVGAYGYVEPTDEYFQAYIDWFKEHHDLELKEEWLIHSLGCIASLDSIFKRLTKPGDEVVLLSPIYNVFFNCIKNHDLIVKESFFKYENYEYSIDWNDLGQKLKSSKAKVFIVCNPHNPIGKLFTSEELKRMAKLAIENNVLIISDEIHCDITDPGAEYVPMLKACPEYKEHIITFLSPTKAFNLAGIQASAIVVPNRKYFEIVNKGISTDDLGDPNYFACDATIAAFKYGREWNKQIREYIYNNRAYLSSFIEKEIPELHVIKGNATYLLWVDISYYSNDAVDFCNKLRKETGLWLCDGNKYGSKGNIFVRINIATSLANIKDCCNRLKTFLKK